MFLTTWPLQNSCSFLNDTGPRTGLICYVYLPALFSQHPQVSSLVDSLGSPTLSTATSSSAVLISALQRGWLDLPSLLSTLVTQAASIRHYPVAVSAIGKALLWEMKVLQQQQGYICPYSLRWDCSYHLLSVTIHENIFIPLTAHRMNVHPFISVLNSRSDCGWCAVSEIKHMCQTIDNPRYNS